MNERIRALWDLSRNKSGRGHDEEKFAELIIRECVKIAYQNDVAKFTRDGYVIGQEIEKHFGVKE